jgi:hypothetical protein
MNLNIGFVESKPSSIVIVFDENPEKPQPRGSVAAVDGAKGKVFRAKPLIWRSMM